MASDNTAHVHRRQKHSHSHLHGASCSHAHHHDAHAHHDNHGEHAHGHAHHDNQAHKHGHSAHGHHDNIHQHAHHDNAHQHAHTENHTHAPKHVHHAHAHQHAHNHNENHMHAPKHAHRAHNGKCSGHHNHGQPKKRTHEPGKDRDSSEDEISASSHNCGEGGHKHAHEKEGVQGHDLDKSHSHCEHSHGHNHHHDDHGHHHHHGHDCGHDHGSGIWAYLPHSHGLHERINADRASLKICCIILTASLCVQIGGGMLVDSSVLAAEAVHTALDGLVLVCSFLSIALASKKTTSKYTYGYGRAEILSALISVLTLVMMCVQLGGGAIRKLWLFSSAHHAVSGSKGLAVTVAEALTLTNNILIAFVLAKNNSLNIRALRAHVIGDSIGNIVVLTAGAVMWKYPHFSILDPLLTLIVVIAICIMNIPLAKETVEVLMQASPLNSKQIHKSILGLPGVKRVRNLHIWTLTSGANIASVKVESDIDNHDHNNGHDGGSVADFLMMQRNIESHLLNQGVDQCTIQVNVYVESDDEDSDNHSDCSQGTVVETTGVGRIKDDNRYGLVGETDDEMV